MQKFSPSIVALVSLSPILFAGSTPAQTGAVARAEREQYKAAPGGRAATPNIALLDVGYLFKNHVRFNGMREDLKRDLAAFQESVKVEKAKIEQLAARLQDYRRGTPDYKSLEEEISQRRVELAAKFELQGREFTRREARIYHNVYQEITDATNHYIQQRGIDMVLRFSGDPVDPEQPDSVLASLNKPVVAYQGGVDITPAILQELNRTKPGPRSVSANARPPTVPFGNP
jgi:Skp family chaperone for outer membrane proteins